MRSVREEVLVLLIAGVVCAMSLPATGYTWQTEIVGDTIGGTPIQVEIIFPGGAQAPGLIERGVGSGTYPVRHWSQQGGVWASTTVTPESDGLAGFAYHPDTGVPYVAYAQSGNVYVAHNDGGGWTSEEAFTGDVSSCSLAFNPTSKRPAVAVAGSGTLSYAWRDASGWQSEPILANHGGFSFPSLAFDPVTGHACMTYSRLFDGVEFASRSASPWDVTRIETTTFPKQTELRFIPGTSDLAIEYLTGWGGNVRVVTRQGGAWGTPEDVTSGPWHESGMDVAGDGTVYVAWGQGDWGSMGLYMRERDWVTGNWSAPELITTDFPHIMNCALDVNENQLGQREIHIAVDGWYICHAWTGPKAGDANLDECVDGLDYVVWSSNYKTGTTWGQGDFTGDQIVDGLDYIVWSTNYEGSCPGYAPAPEPTALLVLGLGGLPLLCRKRGCGA